MKEFITGLFTKLKTSNSFATAIGSRIYSSVPTLEEFPYCLVAFPSEVPEEMLDSNPVIERTQVDIKIYSNTPSSASEVLTLGRLLSTLLDDCVLTISGYSAVRMYRLSSELINFPEDKVYELEYKYESWFYK